MFEKTLTKLALPCGLIWLGLVALTIAAWRAKQRRLFGGTLLLFAVYWMAGNGCIGSAMNDYLERDYRQWHLDGSARYDAVVVLGGGSGEAPNGQAQLDGEGDRVMLGARLYHRGQTEFIVCTGSSPGRRSDDPLDAAASAALLLGEVGVPKDLIVGIGGQNTKEEMRKLKGLIDDRGWQHVGLITSAWHMRRAMRLAKNAGLQLEPLRADFHSSHPKSRSNSMLVGLIPTAGSLRNLELACRELLAGFVGR